MDQDLVINHKALQYLHIQRGNLADLHGADWRKAYDAHLHELFEQITSHVPSCKRVLDIGSGVGGIDVLLQRYYGCEIVMLDGENDPNEVRKPWETFNSRDVVTTFMVDNGVKQYRYMSPQTMEPVFCDLIISISSWCFHYAPAVYLNFVKGCSLGNTKCIIDVRAGRYDWCDHLRKAFWGEPTLIASYQKFDRVMYHGPDFEQARRW